jgi:hypothetical protein
LTRKKVVSTSSWTPAWTSVEGEEGASEERADGKQATDLGGGVAAGL